MKQFIYALRKARTRLQAAEPRLVQINQKYANALEESKQLKDKEAGKAILNRHNQRVAEAQKPVKDAKWELTKARLEILEELRIRGLTDQTAQRAYEIISSDLLYPTAAIADRMIRLLEQLRLPEAEKAAAQLLLDQQIDALAKDPEELAGRLCERLSAGEHNLKSAAGAIKGITEKTLARVRDAQPTQLGKRRQVAEFLTHNPPVS